MTIASCAAGGVHFTNIVVAALTPPGGLSRFDHWLAGLEARALRSGVRDAPSADRGPQSRTNAIAALFKVFDL
jgi:hypothetical protein